MPGERDGITDEPHRPTDAPTRLAPGPEGPNPFRLRSGMDVTFDTWTAAVLAFALVNPPLAAILGIVGLFTCREEGPRRKAMWMTLLAAPLTAGLVYLMMTRS
jgi:hypothetical protein